MSRTRWSRAHTTAERRCRLEGKYWLALNRTQVGRGGIAGGFWSKKGAVGHLKEGVLLWDVWERVSGVDTHLLLPAYTALQACEGGMVRVLKSKGTVGVGLDTTVAGGKNAPTKITTSQACTALTILCKYWILKRFDRQLRIFNNKNSRNGRETR